MSRKLTAKELDDLVKQFTATELRFDKNEADLLMMALQREVPDDKMQNDRNRWAQVDKGQRPTVERGTAVYGYNYHYGGTYNDDNKHVGKPFSDSPTLRALRDHARQRYFRDADVDIVAVVQKYPHMNSGLVSHQDSDPEIDHAYPIVGYSFGVTRSLMISANKDVTLRDKLVPGELVPIQMLAGSQTIMKPGMQLSPLHHGIAKTAGNTTPSPRISITFRAVRKPGTPMPPNVKLKPSIVNGLVRSDRGRDYEVIPVHLQENAKSKRTALDAGEMMMKLHIQHLRQMDRHGNAHLQQQQRSANDDDDDDAPVQTTRRAGIIDTTIQQYRQQHPHNDDSDDEVVELKPPPTTTTTTTSATLKRPASNDDNDDDDVVIVSHTRSDKLN